MRSKPIKSGKVVDTLKYVIQIHNTRMWNKGILAIEVSFRSHPINYNREYMNKNVPLFNKNLDSFNFTYLQTIPFIEIQKITRYGTTELLVLKSTPDVYKLYNQNTNNTRVNDLGPMIGSNLSNPLLSCGSVFSFIKIRMVGLVYLTKYLRFHYKRQ